MANRKSRLSKFLMTFFVCPVLSCLISFHQAEFAEARRRKQTTRGGFHSVKFIQKAARGTCLAPVRSSGQARTILLRNGVRIARTARSAHLISTAISIQQMELLANGNDRLMRGLRVTFPKSRRYSRYLFGNRTIQMGRNHRDGNVAHIAHEIGHHVGNQGLYRPYKRKVPRCTFTRYARKNYSRASARNEEFAEVFAAFITYPELLKNSRNSACRKAFAFFSSYFVNSKQFAKCDSKLLKRAIAQRAGGAMK